jgi:hypothetical protein
MAGGHVDPDGAARRADLAPGYEDVEAAAAAEVEHHLARLESRQGVRIAAGQPHVRALGKGGELLRRVADGDRQAFGAAAAAA